jgi:nucleoside-diphosphate-sugar epimerase
VICDVFDPQGLTQAMLAFRPEMVIHQLTDLPDNLEQLASASAANARIRREGTDNLLAAARQAAATRFIAQSIAWEPTGDGATAKYQLENNVMDFGGVAIRYGQFYGPGTYYPNTIPDHPRVHIDQAAARTIDGLHLAHQILTITENPPSD